MSGFKTKVKQGRDLTIGDALVQWRGAHGAEIREMYKCTSPTTGETGILVRVNEGKRRWHWLEPASKYRVVVT